jgi:hypothetical protein
MDEEKRKPSIRLELNEERRRAIARVSRHIKSIFPRMRGKVKQKHVVDFLFKLFLRKVKGRNVWFL